LINADQTLIWNAFYVNKISKIPGSLTPFTMTMGQQRWWTG